MELTLVTANRTQQIQFQYDNMHFIL